MAAPPSTEEHGTFECEEIQCQALYDFPGEDANDLSFKEGENLTILGIGNDGWWEAKNAQQQVGLVPCTFLKVPEPFQFIINNALESKHSEGHPDFSLKSNKISSSKEIKEKLPEGFHHSILSKLENENCLANYISLKLDESGFSIKDLNQSSSLQLKSYCTPIQMKLKLIAVRQVLELSKDFTIKSRHVRMCLHDGKEVLSNIHTVRANLADKGSNIWVFNKNGQQSLFRCIEDNEIFIRSDKCIATLGILFEFCISFSKADENGELSAGWAFMKLLNGLGTPIKKKTKILKVETAQPFPHFYPQMTSSGLYGLVEKLTNQQKFPRMVVAICTPDSNSNTLMNYFPATLIGPWSCIPIISLYRNIIADDLLKTSTIDTAGIMLSPLYASTIRVFKESDIMDALRVSWLNTSKLKRLDSETIEKIKTIFHDVFIRAIYPIITCNSLLPYVFGDSKREKARQEEINRLLSIHYNNNSLLYSDATEFSPMNLSKISSKIP